MDRDFKGVWFPKEVWLDERLSALDKIILLEIDSLDNEEKGCYASNEYLAEFCQCSERKITESISKLIKFEYAYVESFNGRQRVLKSKLLNYARQSSKNCEAEKQIFPQRNIIDNTNINNKENIINNNIKEKSTKFQKPTLEELQNYINEKGYHFSAEAFIDYYDSVGWKIGKSPMKSWKSACNTWERKYKENNSYKNPYSSQQEVSRETKYPNQKHNIIL